jgi:hypothetical protein
MWPAGESDPLVFGNMIGGLVFDAVIVNLLHGPATFQAAVELHQKKVCSPGCGLLRPDPHLILMRV